jgi:glyoxylase-like metal-dependent hydrolase (beta-lactamase superfamily II)
MVGGFQSDDSLLAQREVPMEQVAVAKSIFHKFIILQAVPRRIPPLSRRTLRGLSVIPFARFLTQVAIHSVSVNPALTIDLNWCGHPRSIAAALLRSEHAVALIDPGPASTLPVLHEKLALQGLRASDLNAILLTHIHLDHAGATGTLVRENSAIEVYVHSRGAPHMVDPSKLLQSASRLYGDDMQRLFGEFLPVPASHLHVLEGGENLTLGTRRLQVLYTPGHASHHVTYFDPLEGIAFVGDTAGISINGHPFILPATPPPDISLELWEGSLSAIAKLHPQKLFLTHFAFSNDPQTHLTRYRERLHHWFELTARILSSSPDEPAAMHRFAGEVAAEAAQFLSPEEIAHYVFNGALNLSWLGLARYHRKRAEALQQPSHS